jgi:EAL domain-containing protein (putative c-di-GMP-specific phosphodiesterase class I)
MGISFRLAVNVSMSALVKLPVKSIVREYRREGDHWPGLILDVTEDQIASDLPACRDFTTDVRSCGIQLAIDDFGRGFLPLARMNEVPFAELKLDRSFVTDCATEKRYAAVCKTIIDLAHNFEATAVAVGVEKPADAHSLFRMGCDLGQGYLFAQPMAHDRFLTLLKQRAEMTRVRPAVAAAG